MQKTVVELEGVNGEWFTLAGPNSGDQGVYLGTDIKGLYDPPVKVVHEEPGNWPGARYLNHRVQKRELTFAVEILSDGADSWLSKDSQWRKAWAFDRDCKLYVTTEESGTRWLKVRLMESPEVDMFLDPNGHGVNRTVMVCVATDPYWYEDDVVYSATTKNDTRFDPNALQLPWPWPQTQLPQETLWIDVNPQSCRNGLNPTDQWVFPKWTVPGSTEKPADPYVPGVPWLGAPKSPATIWVLPDYSWKLDENAGRRLKLPSLIGGLRTEEVQEFFVDGRPTGGTFRLKFGSETTTAIGYNASAQQVEDALVALAGIALGDIDVWRAPNTDETQTVELLGGATGGKWRLVLEGAQTVPLNYNASALEVFTALSALTSVGVVGVTVTEEFQNNIQELIIAGEPTRGTFTLELDGNITRAIPYNATALQVAQALVELPGIGDFDVKVDAELFGGSPWKIEFINAMAGVPINTLVCDVSNLAGGAGIEADVNRLQNGGRKYEIKFQGATSGVNFDQLTGDVSTLTGGKDKRVEVKTVVDGSRPYVVRFLATGLLGGINVSELTGDPAGLTGGKTTKKIVVTTKQQGNTLPAENAIIDTDPRMEQVVSESGSQLWARMNGVRFRHPIPPYTPSGRFQVTVSGAKPGQMVTLRLPRPWSRPWGLE
jgi:hypothetical protein